MIKILFFITTLSGGGAEKVLCNLVNNMDRTKFDITVHTIDRVDASEYLADGITYRYINKAKTTIGKRLFNIWLRVLTQLKLTYRLYIKDDYDIEVAYLEFGPTKIISSSTSEKAAKLAWVHCDAGKNSGFSEVEKIRKQYESFDKIICVSDGVKNGFNSLFNLESKTETLINVIDEEEIYSRLNEYSPAFDKDCINLLAVGRLSAEKCYDKLIKDCGRLKKDGLKIHLDILGDGSEKEKLERLISELDLEDTVSLLGFNSNPYPYINECDFVVCSSKFEGFSTVVTEAILLGKLVVTTPCAGMKELLGDSEYGLIAEDNDDGLYNAMKSVITDKSLYEHYCSQAKLRSAAFRKERVLAQTEELFEKSVKEKKND